MFPTALAVGSMLLASHAGAVNIATDGIGEVAISPYYTVRNGWHTLINLINTSAFPVVVKVRFHEAWNSRDVLDFNIALSAFDVWTAALREADDNTGAILDVTDDDTCTIPQNVDGEHLNALGYSGLDDRGNSNDDGGPQDVDRMREGYIEFIVMGHGERGTDSTTLGGAIETHDCAVVEQAFTDSGAGFTGCGVQPLAGSFLNTAQCLGEPINALKFNYRLINPVLGVEAGGAATTWANFYNPGGEFLFSLDGLIGYTPLAQDDNEACTLHRGEERDAGAAAWDAGTDWFPWGEAGSCMNLATPQTAYGFLEPSLNDAWPEIGGWWDDRMNFPMFAVGARRTVAGNAPGWRGIDALSLTIQRSAVLNEWSSYAPAGVVTDWVVTFPTKTFYVDMGDGRQFGIVPGDRDEAGVEDPLNPGTGLPVPYPPFAQAFAPPPFISPGPSTAERARAGSCNQVSLERFDRQQNTLGASGGVVISPAPSLPLEELCYEANVITFNGGNTLGSPNSLDVDTSGLLPNTNGWMRLDLTVDKAADAAAPNPYGDGNWEFGGLESEFFPFFFFPFFDVDGVCGDGLDGEDCFPFARWSGLPVTGFLVKYRSYGDVTRNFASSMDHGYERSEPFLFPFDFIGN